MTSRSEYRLILRQDNADERLTPLGYKLGLINEERYKKFLDKQELINKEKERVKNTVISPNEKVNGILESCNTSPISSGVRLIDLLKRPELSYEALKEVDVSRPEISDAIFEQVEIAVKYEGYIRKQLDQVEHMRKLEKRLLPEDIDYSDIIGLRLEAREKLNRIRPKSVGQASRISGVSPADVSVLLIYLAKEGKQNEQ